MPKNPPDGPRLIDSAVGFKRPDGGQRIDVAPHRFQPSWRDIDADHRPSRNKLQRRLIHRV
ncbi:hypothetical protein AWB93_22715 [Mycobacterium bohemicum]|uniref:Uncharacterized protein n=1 Tax=Mycobacterium bohemicum TaxID=56425 RepID=A0A1X1QWU6_MYCBE|nr:hypothetical protein AWB93_22715 [Mycobacterium bohemicum]